MDEKITALLAEYGAWREERADLSGAYEDGDDAWTDSDDAGCDLLSRLVEALQGRDE